MIDLSRFQKTADRGVPAWKEAVWIAVKCLFFLPPWPMPSAFRAVLLRLFGAKIGDHFVIRSGVDISMPWRFEAGDHVWVGERAKILSLSRVTLGSSVCLSQEVFLCTGSHRHDREDFALETSPIVVGSHSWIAARVFVGPGVRIGSGVVVGANSTVIRDVADGEVVAGNPAKTIRKSGGT